MNDRAWRFLANVPRLAAIGAILIYQACIRPFLVGGCRHVPSCSHYAIEALTTHGLIRGGVLTARRLLRCHPFSSQGIDPVPPR